MSGSLKSPQEVLSLGTRLACVALFSEGLSLSSAAN